ncbi:hypothetical protein COY62_04275 [bacterium (Candidatus Howlettbacteria) CG_4_10_14_0_8_um_filter_40_9]|nr:MAG: hypothetical protein COY62_04275 [bacterium (Candidatus Howlettbacteria) CG_4_10_14_0_8_um_filter_40_9]
MKDKIKKLAPAFSAIILVLNVYVWSAYAKPIDHNLHLSMFDVGQGDSFYFRTPEGQDVLIDGSPGRSVLSELGKTMPFYDCHIDIVIATHPDLDHIGGLTSVLEKYDVGRFMMTGVNGKTEDYEELKDLLEEKDILVTIAQKGETIKFSDELKMEILAPENMNGKSIENINDSSIVGLLRFKDFEILLTGDAELAEWEDILNTFPKDRKIEILKISHHGSKNGTTEKILAGIKPETALISVGKSNRYGHPHKEVLSALEKFGVKVLRTDEKGTIEIVSDGDHYQIK